MLAWSNLEIQHLNNMTHDLNLGVCATTPVDLWFSGFKNDSPIWRQSCKYEDPQPSRMTPVRIGHGPTPEVRQSVPYAYPRSTRLQPTDLECPKPSTLNLLANLSPRPGAHWLEAWKSWRVAAVQCWCQG